MTLLSKEDFEKLSNHGRHTRSNYWTQDVYNLLRENIGSVHVQKCSSRANADRAASQIAGYAERDGLKVHVFRQKVHKGNPADLQYGFWMEERKDEQPTDSEPAADDRAVPGHSLPAGPGL